MPTSLPDSEFQALKQSLPAVFQEAFINEEGILGRAYPLLSMICADQDRIRQLEDALSLSFPTPKPGPTYQTEIENLGEKLATQLNVNALFKYRLPILLGEFPIHTRVINQAIQAFNRCVEYYHQDPSHVLDEIKLTDSFHSIITAIKAHGAHCDSDSLGQLLHLMAGWCTETPGLSTELLCEEPLLAPQEVSHVELCETSPAAEIPHCGGDGVVFSSGLPRSCWGAPDDVVIITEEEQCIPPLAQNPFIADYNYNFNRAGRLASETDTLLLNAFGMKIGGHFDAQVKYPPTLLPINLLHAIIHRQLSHRMEIPKTIEFRLWIELTLNALGLKRVAQNPDDPSSDLFINPFLGEPISSLSPEKIQGLLHDNLLLLTPETLNPSPEELDIVTHYLFEFLHSFQINPGQALGIGANWDGTINLTNESGAYSFKFRESEAGWGKRFKQLSLHRQGPAEVYMNAAKGINYEIQSMLTDFDYMSQLQPSEYDELLYNALVDNLVSELFPAPAYFENQQYKKYRKQYVVKRTPDSDIELVSFFQPSNNGTYFIDKAGKAKQTPMFRRAGTLDVQPFPRNTAYSEDSRASYAGNPLGPLQLQYAQSLHKSTRGHLVYDPIAPDQFLPDAYYGQVILSDNGDCLPFIGVIPKNFDKHFNQPKELCASFVIRMLQSSRIMAYSPTFRNAYERIKTRFLPARNTGVPELPALVLNHQIVSKHQQLATILNQDERQFSACERVFYSLFKNLIYNVYDCGKEDDNFKCYFFSLTNNPDTFYPPCKATCEKIIRDLTVNRPITASPSNLNHYDETLHYVRELTSFFYPKPTDELAITIARVAKRHSEPLLQTQQIKAYFASLQYSQQANLSRRQTPGMVYAALKHGGASKTIAEDYNRMHEANFPSYYRDPEGASFSEPQTSERVMDWCAKKVGASLQLIHKYNLLAVVRKPFSQSFTQAKQMAAAHQKSKKLWAIMGGIKGFFVDGIAVGLWQTITTPAQMLGDAAVWGLHALKKKNNHVENNPLAISAAPMNEPSLKVKTITASRDYILQLLGTRQENSKKKNALITHAMQLTKLLYPQLTKKEIALCHQQLNDTFPLNDEELAQLFNPYDGLLGVDEEEASARDSDTDSLLVDSAKIAMLFMDYTPYINQDFIHAAYQCLIDPDLAKHPKKVIKQTQSFFTLNAKQKEALTQLMRIYQHMPAGRNRHQFVTLFQFRGNLHTALQVRDKQIQKIQRWVGNVFDNPHCPANLVEKLGLSALDIAHNKWSLFAERELRHQLLSSDDAHEIFTILFNKLKKFPDLTSKLSMLTIHYQQLSVQRPQVHDDDLLHEFYMTAYFIQNKLIELIRCGNKTDRVIYEEVHSLLTHFIDVTLNALVNSRLDDVDLFSEEASEPKNPLINSEAIESWLTHLKASKQDLRALLEQQIQQSPSLDHALWRNQCIFQLLEKSAPGQRVTKTGSQSLLRFWYQHRDNVTKTGEIYRDPQTGEPCKIPNTNGLKGSITLSYAMERVQQKLSVSRT